MNIPVEKKKRVRKSREERMSEIIQAATKVFTEEGYSELTLRRVAKDIGVRLSTIQYYFETKDDLLDALLKNQVDFFSKRPNLFQEDPPRERLIKFVEFLLATNKEIDVCKFFTQLWAMGFQHESSRQHLAYMYEAHREDLAKMIQAVKPEMDELECLKRATVISSMIEGSLVHTGSWLPQRPEFEGVQQRIIDQIMRIVCE